MAEISENTAEISRNLLDFRGRVVIIMFGTVLTTYYGDVWSGATGLHGGADPPLPNGGYGGVHLARRMNDEPITTLNALCARRRGRAAAGNLGR